MNEESPQMAARRLAAAEISEGFRLTALHEYTDEKGAPIYWRIRCKHDDGRKWIRPMQWTGDVYEKSEPVFEHRKPLYLLHQLAGNSTVWIVEGEQKADALAKLGLCATTSGGCTSADSADWTPLKGRTVIVWPDNDVPGRTYAGDVSAILLGMGCKASCVDVAALKLPDKADCVDWLKAHPEASKADVEALPILKPKPERIVALDYDAILTMDFPPMEAMLVPWLCRQHLSLIHAWRGVGKTHFALGVAYAVASGGTYLKWTAEKPFRVVYIDGEMSGASIQARLAAIVKTAKKHPPKGYFQIITPDTQSLPIPDLATAEGQAALAPRIAEAELIVVDNLSCLMRTGEENKAEGWHSTAEWALDLRRQGKTVLFVAHDGKNGERRGSSKVEDILDCVLHLTHEADYDPEKGAAFTCSFVKARHLTGKDAADIEAALGKDGSWTWREAALEMADRIRTLKAEAPDMNQKEIAEELGCSRSTVSRALKP